MSFTNYLKSRQKLLIIWFVIHGIALFVNHYEIEGNVKKPSSAYGAWVNLFTEIPFNNAEREQRTNFWPFVSFYESNTVYIPTGYYSYEQKNSEFRGVFYLYDSSEFIAYSILIFIILYFMWNSTKLNADMPQTSVNRRTELFKE